MNVEIKFAMENSRVPQEFSEMLQAIEFSYKIRGVPLPSFSIYCSPNSE